MDSKVKIYMNRAFNEIKTSEVLFEISNNNQKKIDLEINEEETFYSAVISHAYYSIFYATKAILLTKNIKTQSPEVHKKTYDEFKKIFVDSGLLDFELLKIYKKMIIKADELLEIFKEEKWKRGHYTYHTLPQANKEPAHESVNNAKKFVSNINVFLSDKNVKL